MKQHTYSTEVRWTGNDGEGTKTYRSYRREHVITAKGKPPIEASSDPAFRGDPSRYNPEDMLVAALSSCHMLSYLHLCAVNKVVVVEYEDNAMGTMEELPNGSGHFVSAVLRPKVTISAESEAEKAKALHHDAHELCFIANSVNFPVSCDPQIVVSSEAHA